MQPLARAHGCMKKKMIGNENKKVMVFVQYFTLKAGKTIYIEITYQYVESRNSKIYK